MYYVGIDIGKYEHAAAALDSDGQVVLKPIKIKSDVTGYQKLLKNIDTLSVSHDQLLIGMEATGHYWMNLYEKLAAAGFTVIVLNPLQVKSFRNQSMRGNKTDAIDALLIAKVIRFGETMETQLAGDVMLGLRSLTRYRADLAGQMTDLKNRAIALLDQVFPEFNRLFSNMFGVAALELLKEASTPDEIVQLDDKKLLELISTASRGAYGPAKAQEIKNAAGSSFGLRMAQKAFSLQMKLIISEIEHLKTVMNTLDEEIERHYEKLNVKLTTIPGVSTVTASAIAAEIEDIRRFGGERGGATALVAFAGMDPRLKESGLYRGKVKMSKRGNRYLRRAIYQASFVASYRDEFFKAIYEKERKKGKAHKVALTRVGVKMLHIIHHMLKFDEAYVPMTKND